MWETLLRAPRGSNSQRKFSHVLVTFLVAVFAYLIATTPTAFAAEATWDGDIITFEGKNFQRIENSEAPGEFQGSAGIYRGLDPIQGTIPTRVYFVYFSSTAEDIKAEKEATYKLYLSTSLSPPYELQEPAIETRTISVGGAEGESGEGSGEGATSCAVDNVGWLVCGVGGWIADGIDIVYEAMSTFLKVQPLTTDGSSSLYNLWDVIRNFANVAFVIGFLVVIYSYLVGGGFNGYEIRKILPRVVVAAILINVSFWICSLAVDISNIIGVSLQELLINIRENSVAVAENRNVGWGEITAYILSGGAIGALGFLAATGGSIASFGFLLLGVLIVVVFALFVAFIILAARQAILIVLIVLSPLAFAAFILPNTEKWFDRWRSTFTTLLVLFPIFSLLFGGSQLAGAAIIQNAPDDGAGLAIMLFGMAVQIVPLVITPLLIQFSGSLLGRIAGIVNNPGKGMVDRSRNWAKDRQELHRQKNLAQPNTGRNNWNMARRGAQRMYAKDVARKKRLESYQKDAETLAHDKEFGTGRIANSRFGKATGMQERLQKQSYGYWDEQYRGADIRHNASAAHHDRHFATALNTNPEYAALRDMKKRTAVDSGVADVQNAAVDAAGQEDLRRTIEGSRDLSRVVKDTYHSKEQAQIYENIVQKAAEKSWKDRIRNDADTQASYLKGVRYEAGASVAEKRLEEFSGEIRARGSETRGLIVGNEAIANTIQATDIELASRDSAIAELKDEQSGIILKRLSTDKSARMVAGAGTQMGATKVLAKAQSGITKQYLENVKAQNSVYSNDGYRVDEMLQAMQNSDYRLHDGTKVNTIAQHAAVQYVMEDIGNNWSVQKIIDWADTKGMELVEGANGQPDKYYDGAEYRAWVASGKQGQAPKELTSEEIGERRDLLQMVVGGYRNGKNKVSYFTATMQERMNRGLSSARYSADLGRDMSFSETSILGEARMQKYEGGRITGLDPDELAHMAQVLRDPKFRDQLDTKQRSSIVEKIVQAQSSNQTRHLIKDRERGLMNIVASYLEIPQGENPSENELKEIEKFFYEVDRFDENGEKYSVRVPKGTEGARRVEASVKVPNVYDYSRQNDYVSGAALEPPR